ncbi:hypothetical protein [Cellulosilyticum ruminicola]|uniref:hypothetical protein n=1 Tax=Cellulosilyticum ruminicola TaxID=425254 RepID=UPI0012ED16B0|nr:hypothetical protein [Cellulosilyticum ruminicola]
MNQKVVKPINASMEYDENFICDVCFEVKVCPLDCGGSDCCDGCDGVCKPFVW